MRTFVGMLGAAVLALAVAVVALYLRPDPSSPTPASSAGGATARTTDGPDDLGDRVLALEQRVDDLAAQLAPILTARQVVTSQAAETQIDAPSHGKFPPEDRTAVLQIIDDDLRRRAFEEHWRPIEQVIKLVAEHYGWDVEVLTPIVLEYERRSFDQRWSDKQDGVPERGSPTYAEALEYTRAFQASMDAAFGPLAAKRFNSRRYGVRWLEDN